MNFIKICFSAVYSCDIILTMRSTVKGSEYMSDENFLKILKSALSGEQIAFNRSLSADEWKHIFMLAENHRVLPMILDSIHASFNFDITELKDIRNRSKLLITQQVIQTQNFLDLYKIRFTPKI